MKTKDTMLRLALIALVAVSLVFTWIIWFNPAHLEHRTTSNVSVKTPKRTATKKEKTAVFLPVAVYQQKDDQKKLLVNSTTDMPTRLHTALKTAQIKRVLGSKVLSSADYQARITQDDTVQMVYADKMSWRLWNQLYLHNPAQVTGSEFAFDRIAIDMRHATLSFMNDTARTVRKVSFAKTPNYGQIARALTKADAHFTVVETRLHDRYVAMYPEGLAVQPFAYLIDEQGANHFVAALLGDQSTSTVDAKQVGEQTIYTVNNNNQRLITNKNDSQMRYNNFATSGPKKSRQGVLTDAYTQMTLLAPTNLDGVRFTRYDTATHTVTFRTYVDGLALFNQTMSGAVAVTRTDGSLELSFSGANLSVPVPTRETAVKLPSTTTVLANIRDRGFTNAQIEDVQPGYRWKKDSDSLLVIDLEPTYYVCIDGNYYDYADIMADTVTPATVKAKTNTTSDARMLTTDALTTTP